MDEAHERSLNTDVLFGARGLLLQFCGLVVASAARLGEEHVGSVWGESPQALTASVLCSGLALSSGSPP